MNQTIPQTECTVGIATGAASPKVPPPIIGRRSLLEHAEQLIGGQRQEEYGNKLVNFSQIAMGMQMVLAGKMLPGMAITPEDVALLMIQVKIARLAKMPDHYDSILDVAGYAGCYRALQLDREAGEPLPGAIHDPRTIPF
jgi:Domain of unknown function (DUF6378)